MTPPSHAHPALPRRILTRRLVLAHLVEDDIDDLAEMYRQTNTRVDPVGDARERVEDAQFTPYEVGLRFAHTYSIRSVIDRRWIGMITATTSEKSRRMEIGYGVMQGERRKGFGSEAAGALTKLCLDDPEVLDVLAAVDYQNEASMALLRSLGYEATDDFDPTRDPNRYFTLADATRIPERFFPLAIDASGTGKDADTLPDPF